VESKQAPLFRITAADVASGIVLQATASYDTGSLENTGTRVKLTHKINTEVGLVNEEYRASIHQRNV